MKILVVSDSHRNYKYMDIAVDWVKPDRIFHLGDGEGCEDYLEVVSGCPVEIVRGNCDFMSDLPGEVIMRVGAHEVMLTHGHYYNVNYGLDQLVAAAKEKGADTVFYGHTHVPEIVEVNGVTVVNPGSISYPRQRGKEPSYAVVEVDDKGEFRIDLHYMQTGK